MTPLSEIKARLEKATPGKWDYSENGVGYIYSDSEGGNRSYICEAILNNDVALIVHARTDIEKLLKALELAVEQRDLLAGMIAKDHGIRIDKMNLAEFNAAIEACLKGETP